MTNKEIKAKITELEAQLIENEAEKEAKTVTLTQDELVEKMAKAFVEWAAEDEDPNSLVISLVVGGSVTKNLCKSLFGKED